MREMFLFGGSSNAHSPGHRTDFHAQYIKQRDSELGCAFSGLENKNLIYKILNPLIWFKTAIFWPGIDWKENFRITLGDAPVNSL